MIRNVEKFIGSYKKPNASFNPYDPNAPLVAKTIKKRVESYMTDIVVEHIGSTSIPGCRGKGIVDLMTLYKDGKLDVTKSLLEEIGFQRQGKEYKNRFPDERPVYMGTFKYNNKVFLIYNHVLYFKSYEAERFRIFRDRLISNSDLLFKYMAVKEKIISDGVTDTDIYVKRKKGIIKEILGDAYDLG